ncbi:MAG TPA: hypothetical protein VMT20_07025 [Terriglobia bacterium]|nr:hypothetical protein [Terriglobia bacterium]
MGLYIAGEENACAKVLLAAIENCERAWTGDRAYRDILFKLDQVEQELSILTASAGHRAALRAQGPNMAGQIPEERSEAPSEAQRG